MNQLLVIGTGFAGLGMGVRLKQAGLDDFLILEAADEVGGTWRDNHYPGAACDVPSFIYSFSFEPYPGWSRAYAEQPQIFAYLKHCADKYQLRPHIRFGRRVVSASWDQAAALWTVETDGGERYQARVVVSGCGGLSRPKEPDIPGLASFAGATFHSARWRHDVPLDGKRIGVIGTGASAIQIVPSIAPAAGKLSLFQRTPAWILPKQDRTIGRAEQALYRWFPPAERARRAATYLKMESAAVGFVMEPRILRWAQKFAIAQLERQVADPELRRRLTPSYTMGCKRILLSNDYYPALTRPNVELVTDGIDTVTPAGVRTRDGREHQLDALVLATGFQAAEQLSPFRVIGRDGADLDALWRDGAEAYLGTAVTGFPNFFSIIGPNTGLGHNSMVFMIESQIAYIVDALRTMRSRRLRAVEVRDDVQRRYNDWLQRRLADTVWSSGCMSWYVTASGKNTAIWPGFTWQFRLRTRRFDAAAYHVDAEQGAGAGARGRVAPSLSAA